MKTLLVSCLIPVALAAAEAIGACSDDASTAEVRAAVGGLNTASELVGAGGCEKVHDEEGCVCAAFRLGWYDAARTSLRSRLVRKLAVQGIRSYAQAAHDAMRVLLAVQHPKYPQHLRFAPAVNWAQTDEFVTVMLRHARYNRGEALFTRSENPQLFLSDVDLRYAVEGGDKPAYVSAELQWRHRVRRRDGCEDREVQCVEWAAQGVCSETPPPTGAPSWAERCPLSCGGCPPANGTAIDASWAAVSNGLLVEFRKAQGNESWDRLLEAARPLYRVDELSGRDAPPVGSLLGCLETCTADRRCPLGMPRDGSAGSGPTSGLAAGATHDAQCVEQCRRSCATDVGSSYYV
jgi:hypothetical protein